MGTNVASRDLKQLIRDLNAQASEPCVSILLNTHRTHPDNTQDPINLKKLMHEAEQRLLARYDKRQVWPVMERIQQAAAGLDHNYNLDALALFATAAWVHVERLPVAVKDRAIVGRDFATRDVLRAAQGSPHYHILTLSGHKSRLIEAHRDTAVREYGAGHTFPIPNRLYNTFSDQRAQANVEEDLRREFCNRVDKAMQAVHKELPLPIMLAGDARNIAFFHEVADHPSWYIGHITLSPDELQPDELAKLAFAEVLRIDEAHRRDALAEIGSARNTGRLITDIGGMYRAARDGRAAVFFAEEDRVQPARVVGDAVEVSVDRDAAEVDMDVFDTIAELTIGHGGRVYFLPAGVLAEHGGACLVARW